VFRWLIFFIAVVVGMILLVAYLLGLPIALPSPPPISG